MLESGPRPLAAALLGCLALATCWPKDAPGEQRVRLAEPTVIEGVPCAQRAQRATDGRLLGCTLARERSFGDHLLPAGTWVELDREGRLAMAFLPATTRLQGHLCRGRGNEWMTSFHANGRLRLCWLAGEELVQGVPCAGTSSLAEIARRLGGGSASGLLLYDDGRLESCRLARAVQLGGRTVRRGWRVRLDPGGELVAAWRGGLAPGRDERPGAGPPRRGEPPARRLRPGAATTDNEPRRWRS